MKLGQHFIASEDNRGKIIDLIQNEAISAVTLVTFNSGAVRGNHYHLKTIQWNYVLKGKIQYCISINGETFQGELDEGRLLRIDKSEQHALKALESSSLLVFTLGPRGGKEYESDTFRLTTPLLD